MLTTIANFILDIVAALAYIYFAYIMLITAFNFGYDVYMETKDIKRREG